MLLKRKSNYTEVTQQCDYDKLLRGYLPQLIGYILHMSYTSVSFPNIMISNI